MNPDRGCRELACLFRLALMNVGKAYIYPTPNSKLNKHRNNRHRGFYLCRCSLSVKQAQLTAGLFILKCVQISKNLIDICFYTELITPLTE